MTAVSNNVANASAQRPTNKDPNAFAQEYANKHGMTLEAAKTELSKIYGDPQKPDENEQDNGSIFETDAADGSTASEDVTAQELDEATAQEEDDSDDSFASFMCELLGINKDDKTQEKADLKPDEVAQKYADKYGVSLDAAKEALKTKFGEPKTEQQ